jgi:hypothetical protein
MVVMGMAMRVTMAVVVTMVMAVIVGMRMRHGGRTGNANENKALKSAMSSIYVTL